jgi:pseudaminic acid biosynthesis-associated methylase
MPSRKPASRAKSGAAKKTTKFRTEQEAFWAGEFGDEYISRNQEDRFVGNNAAFFSRILARTGRIKSAIEFGSNIGLNLRALKALIPEIALHGVDINEKALAQLRKVSGITGHHASFLEFRSKEKFDFAFSKGVLIHIAPAALPKAYETLYRASGRFICLAEYYNRTPVSIPYRGHDDRLFKRDFAGDMLEKYRDLKLIDYGFAYHRDPTFRQDDLTWFLLEKK